MTGHAPDVPSAAAAVVALLRSVSRTVAVAESLTGGAVTDALVAVPGASRCVRGGVVAYATDLKSVLLGVDGALLRRHGAVHPDVARAMARGARARLGADYGLATTGVAGPDPQDGQAPGTFHIAVEGPWGGDVVSREPGRGGAGDRAAVRAAARDTALAVLAERVARDRAAGEVGAGATPGAAPGAAT